MSQRFQTFHRPFALSGGLKRILGAVIEITGALHLVSLDLSAERSVDYLNWASPVTVAVCP
jgi:hypothetical protein